VMVTKFVKLVQLYAKHVLLLHLVQLVRQQII
jgi:hypothetical protein